MAKKLGRPPKPPEEVASERLDIRLTPAEKAEFERAATLLGLSLSEWLRSHLKAAAAKDLKKQGVVS